MKLKEIRESKKISAEEMAKAMDVTEELYGEMEDYNCLPTPPKSRKMLKKLDCVLEDVYEPHEVYVKVGSRSGTHRPPTEVYKLTAELPVEAREFFRSNALQECGYQSINEWANACYTKLCKTYKKIKADEKQGKPNTKKAKLLQKLTKACKGKKTT